MFHDLKWSPSEKKIARKAYDTALEAALAKVMAEFKRRADAVATPSNMWDVEDYLCQQRREIEETFGYRYSQLPFVLPASFEKGIWMKVSSRGCRKKSSKSFVRSSAVLRERDHRCRRRYRREYSRSSHHTGSGNV